MKEIICPSCKKWNQGDKSNCGFCGSPLDRNVLRKEELRKINPPAKEVKTQPEWVEKLVFRAHNSKNPMVRFMLRSAITLWMVYMALVGFVLWSVAWLAG